jgi:hypothetical protein
MIAYDEAFDGEGVAPDMSAAFYPEWVPCMLPVHVESLCAQVTEAFRGPGHGTTNFYDVFSDERRELQHAFVLASRLYASETPL